MSHRVVKSGVYVLYSKGEVVYIGESDNLYNRIGTHIREGMKDFDSFDVYETSDRFRLESFLIYVFHPKYNIAPGIVTEMTQPCNDLFQMTGVESAIKSYEDIVLHGRAFVTYKQIAEDLGTYERSVFDAMQRHQEEVPRWNYTTKNHAERGEDFWRVDSAWYRENKERVKQWIFGEARFIPFIDEIKRTKNEQTNMEEKKL